MEEQQQQQEAQDMVEEETRKQSYGTTSYGRRSETKEKKSTITLFSEYDIEVATNYFSDSNMIRKGTSGSVYRGYLDSIEVAIKMLDVNRELGLKEFHQEMEALGRRMHPNVVKLIGACPSLRSLVFEFLPNGSLEDCLCENPSILTWQMRTHIVYEICSALTFLHTMKPRRLVHCHIRPSKILLEGSFRSKLTDFGRCNFLTERTATDVFFQTNETRDAEWYMDPIFLATGLVTPACDLYSFGVTILRLLTGKPADTGIIGAVHKHVRKNSLMTIVVPTAENWPVDVSEHLARLAFKCCRVVHEERNFLALKYCCIRVLRTVEKGNSLINNDMPVSLFGFSLANLARLVLTCCWSKEKAGNPPGLTEEITEKLRDFLAANDNFKTYLLHLDKNSTSTNIPSSVKVVSYMDIERATNCLSDSSKIGQGAYGSVYKGYLNDNTEVAIKMLDTESTQGEEEFNRELVVLAQISHPNLVKLIGVCFRNHSLIYEFLPNGSVQDCLKNSPGLLTWQIRTRIVYEICSTLIFLHSIEPEPLLHGDLKPANILLDDHFNIKLADFGLCRFLPQGTDTIAYHKTSNFKGTEWFIDPDYLATGKLSPGCDVYSFGVTILVILTGASPVDLFAKVYEEYYARKSLMKIVDSTAGAWPDHVAKYLARIGLRCCEPRGRRRSEIMMEMSSDLNNILDKIGS